MAKRITELTSATVLAETDLLPVVDVSDTTQATSGTTKKSALSLIADYLKARVETLTNKTLSTGSVVDANVNVIEVLKKAYPIGSVYINASNATNPASLLGFGTWVAFGAGKVMVGLDAGDTSFDTLGETGGVKDVTLTSAQSGLVGHNHTQNSHEHSVLGGSGTAGGVSVYIFPQGSITNTFGGTIGKTSPVAGTNNAVSSANASESHTNLQPYIVVYFWKRTA